MNNQEPFVQRYRRTDLDRMGEWAPVGSSWKTAASAGLVAHDMFHHLPTDTGTFAQEVASLGAEWYIEWQRSTSPTEAEFATWSRTRFERNVFDTVLNALDSKEQRPFDLPAHTATPLSDIEMGYFRELVTKVHETVRTSTDPRACERPAFEVRFVQMLLWGYAQAKSRFPDQKAVRQASADLTLTLSELDLSEVPYEHEVTVTLDGTRCTVAYDDADADYLSRQELLPAVMMGWCSCEQSYPLLHVTLHLTARDYAEYVAAHFEQQDAQGLALERQVIPQAEQRDLAAVYVRDAAIQAQLQCGEAVLLPIGLMQVSDYTPRGVRVI